MALKRVTLPSSLQGQRVDNVVRRYLPELTDSDIRAIFQHRDVKLNGVRVRADVRVCGNEELAIYYMPPSSSLQIVHEDSNVLFLNKRAGISVESDEGGGTSLEELVRHYAGTQARACHRLDNQTCGLILFAKNEYAYNVLTDVFREHTLDKRYICLVRGAMKPPEAICRAFLLKDADLGKVTVLDHNVPGAKPITTGYRTLSYDEPLSRLEIQLITGRTHQIRAHLAALGHPLLGDDLYGDRALNRRLHAQGKLMLCCTSLTLDTGGKLPDLDGKTFSVSCPF